MMNANVAGTVKISLHNHPEIIVKSNKSESFIVLTVFELYYLAHLKLLAFV
jgi:hypothetical protein